MGVMELEGPMNRLCPLQLHQLKLIFATCNYTNFSLSVPNQIQATIFLSIRTVCRSISGPLSRRGYDRGEYTGPFERIRGINIIKPLESRAAVDGKP
jgi:hypothetical protein